MSLANFDPKRFSILAIICSMCLATSAMAQEKAATASVSYRKLAPGVMKEVDLQKQTNETFCRHDMIELLAVDPAFDWAKDVVFRRDIWNLYFRFKPVRMIDIDIPQKNGNMQRKKIWYLVYSVTNKGKAMHPVEDADGTYKVVDADTPIRFIPQFQLEATEFDKRYPDRVIPIAMGPIRRREDPKRKFCNSVEMTRQIAVNETVWGVATWESVDPKVDRFSIYVHGLTNAYLWKDDPAKYKKGDSIGKGRRLARKTLKLNFWRPGDEYYEHEKEIRYGIPGEVDYEWLYR